MVIAPIRILKETSTTYIIRWYDMELLDHVFAVFRKKDVQVTHISMRLEREVYDKITKRPYRS